MIWFRAWAPSYFWYLKGRRLFETGRSKQCGICQKSRNNWKCNSKKHTVNTSTVNVKAFWSIWTPIALTVSLTAHQYVNKSFLARHRLCNAALCMLIRALTALYYYVIRIGVLVEMRAIIDTKYTHSNGNAYWKGEVYLKMGIYWKRDAFWKESGYWKEGAKWNHF